MTDQIAKGIKEAEDTAETIACTGGIDLHRSDDCDRGRIALGRIEGEEIDVAGK